MLPAMRAACDGPQSILVIPAALLCFEVARGNRTPVANGETRQYSGAVCEEDQITLVRTTCRSYQKGTGWTKVERPGAENFAPVVYDSPVIVSASGDDVLAWIRSPLRLDGGFGSMNGNRPRRQLHQLRSVRRLSRCARDDLFEMLQRLLQAEKA